MKYILILIVVCANAFGDTISATTLIDFEASTDGTPVTPTILLNSLHGNSFDGFVTSNDPSAQNSSTVPSLQISTSAAHAIYTPIIVSGTTYSSAGTRGLRAIMDADNAFQLYLSPGVELSVGFFFRFNGNQINNSPRDVVALRSDPTGNYQFLQIYDGSTPLFHAHWQPGGTGIGDDVNFNRNQWYWVTMKHVAGGGTFRVRFYDPNNSYALLGESTGSVSGGDTTGCTTIQFGCIKYSSGGTQSVDFDNIIIDTSGTFPLGPGSGPSLSSYTSLVSGNITFRGSGTLR